MVGAVRLFPWLALGASLLAFEFPRFFAPLGGAIIPLLGLVMFGMGLTLSVADFRRIAERPGTVALGVGLQFALMPALAWMRSALLTGG